MSFKKEECLDVYFRNGMGMNPFFGLLIVLLRDDAGSGSSENRG